MLLKCLALGRRSRFGGDLVVHFGPLFGPPNRLKGSQIPRRILGDLLIRRFWPSGGLRGRFGVDLGVIFDHVLSLGATLEGN